MSDISNQPVTDAAWFRRVADLLGVSLVHIWALLLVEGSVDDGWCYDPAGGRSGRLCPGQDAGVSSRSGGDPCIFKQLQDSQVSGSKTFQAVHCQRSYSGRWGVLSLPPPPNTRSCSVDVQWPGPCGLQTSNSWCRLTAWIKYRLWLRWGGSRGEGGGALTQAVLPQTDQQTTLSVISPVIYQWVLQTRVLLTDTLWWVQKFSFISEP